VIKQILKSFFTKPNSKFDKSSDIGMHTYIGAGGFITKSTIGNYSTIANNVFIGQWEHDYKQIALSGQLYNFNSYEKYTQDTCIIGNDVWIGVGAIVLRGVTIGDGVVIGANSVVTKDIPDYAIAVGSPAKVIKYRFSQKKIKKIKDSKWWDYEIEEARKIVARLEKELKNND
jgi:virginiamycin A acetyltransferase